MRLLIVLLVLIGCGPDGGDPWYLHTEVKPDFDRTGGTLVRAESWDEDYAWTTWYEDGSCLIQMPKGNDFLSPLDTSLLGHELLHCFYGAWHPVK